MPLRQIKNLGFLREGELETLGHKKGISVTLIQPSLNLTKLTLVRWDMRKENGTNSSNYVLRSSWMNVVNSNQLEEGDKVQVWSFRVQEELHIALVKSLNV
ncbi:hypothetical protein TanjilG_08325 [Lupinus angustifolius]|uniref:TF-B3 domain-containing protein n=1 Tax=Lupinus angustifolius TaxID=3871 RepID=A0A394DF90_LUPAN|nr:hypothetical protein TanjilG_08325 [Lupinus angustifolius]